MDSTDVEQLTGKWFCNECEYKQVKKKKSYEVMIKSLIVIRENLFQKDLKGYLSNWWKILVYRTQNHINYLMKSLIFFKEVRIYLIIYNVFTQ